MTELVFYETEFAVVERDGQNWLTGLQVASALGYKNPSADSINLYNRHADEFTPGMTQIIKLMSPGGYQDTRVFSLRGAHLLAMFARTGRAAEFRRWVLDILDRVTQDQAAVPPAPTFAPMDHGADILVSADRTFRAMLRTCRAAGLRLPQALARANAITRQRTGFDVLAAIELDPATSVGAEPSEAETDELAMRLAEFLEAEADRAQVSVREIAQALFDTAPDDGDYRALATRLGMLLSRLGWRRRRLFDEGRPYVYERPH